MSTTEQSESTAATPKTRTANQAPQKVDKFAEARLAKKKQRRRAHRATIRRSNTNG
jgi:hypothetical protein